MFIEKVEKIEKFETKVEKVKKKWKIAYDFSQTIFNLQIMKGGKDK